MYLHLGGDVIVNTRDILGIFDMDTSTISKHTRAFLSLAEKQKRVVNISDDLPKSYVLCERNGGVRVYISQISSTTLLRRSQANFFGI